jgi:hypothetical protein
MQDSRRIFAPTPPKSHNTSVGSVARMGFFCQILRGILGESSIISTGIPAHSCTRILGCMRLIEPLKQSNTQHLHQNRFSENVMDHKPHHKWIYAVS